MNALEKAAEIVGSQAKLAALLGVSKAAVNQWKLPGRKVPLKHCQAIEYETHGQVRCEDLRPDINWRVVRNDCTRTARLALPHTTYSRIANGHKFGIPLKRRATDKDEEESA
jgi:DNA-binding transcriptional regulator YdaS (Cro superfamily)